MRLPFDRLMALNSRRRQDRATLYYRSRVCCWGAKISPQAHRENKTGVFSVASADHRARGAEARKVLEQLNELAKQRYVPAYSRALIYTGLGERNQAIEWLEKAYEERSGSAIYFGPKVLPAFDSLRSDARFQALLRRVGL